MKTRLVSHRGFLNGSDKDRENRLDSIKECVDLGFDCEIDLWEYKNELYLGHNEPIFPISLDFLLKNYDKLWLHTKNIRAFYKLGRYELLNVFWQDKDEYSLTSRGFIWANYNTEPTNISVMMLKNKEDKIPIDCYGICTDYPLNYK